MGNASRVSLNGGMAPLSQLDAGPEPGLRPRGPLWLRILLVPVFAIVPTYLALGLTLTVPGLLDTMGDTSNPTRMVAAASGFHVAVLGLVLLSAWLFMRFLQRRPLRSAGLLWTRHSAPLLGLGLLIAITVVWAAKLPTAGAGLLRPDGVVFSWANLIGLLTAAFLMQGFPEELFFRGVILHLLQSRPLVAVLTSTLLFGALHYASSGGQQNVAERFVYLGAAAAFGFAAAALLVRTGSLWVAVGIHAGEHLGSRSTSWAGLGDGPAAWLVQIALYTVVGLIAQAASGGDWGQERPGQ